MKRAPIIGITTHSRNDAGEYLLPGTYVDAVQTAGGTPILLPPNQPNPEDLFQALDGLIFSGGGDINPDLYEGSPHHTIYGTDEDRDTFELALSHLALKSTIPVLGICRGMQMLTVASGGQLVAHVPEVYGDQIAHRLDHPRRPTPHDVFVMPESRLAEILGTHAFSIVSWHHQSARSVPLGWRLAAQSHDGVIEALEHLQHPWMMALQWHPELSAEHSAHQQLFEAFVAAARGEFSHTSMNHQVA
jgi:putative glutamine amidotransferase